MLFNSIEFLFFFPIITSLYFILPHKYRWQMLLFASCIFYMAFIPVYILILAVTIVIDYFAGILIEQSEGKKRKLYLIISIISTCMVLFVFKYFNFFNNSFSAIAAFFHLNYPIEALNIILPIGLSFHTFQSLSYVIEVYRCEQKAEKHFGIYSLYVMFYPQLVAGPIERPQNLLHQFYEKHEFDYDRITGGLKLMAWGMFKKVVIADRLAIVVNNIYSAPASFDGPTLALATICFAFQIYCDFSGYADIAVGAARVMGFRLMENFNMPYLSKSISEFWQRWHISLSTWFRDYLYITLGGNRVTRLKLYRNLLITFFISGLWHGANWTYVSWGVINGIYLVIGHWTKDFRNSITGFIGLNQFTWLHNWLKIIITFKLTCFAWIFFRARDMSDAFYIVIHIFSGWSTLLTSNGYKNILNNTKLEYYEFLVAIIAILLMIFIHTIIKDERKSPLFRAQPLIIRWSLYYSFILIIIFFGVFSRTQFIYFQF